MNTYNNQVQGYWENRTTSDEFMNNFKTPSLSGGDPSVTQSGDSKNKENVVFEELSQLREKHGRAVIAMSNSTSADKEKMVLMADNIKKQLEEKSKEWLAMYGSSEQRIQGAKYKDFYDNNDKREHLYNVLRSVANRYHAVNVHDTLVITPMKRGGGNYIMSYETQAGGSRDYSDSVNTSLKFLGNYEKHGEFLEKAWVVLKDAIEENDRVSESAKKAIGDKIAQFSKDEESLKALYRQLVLHNLMRPYIQRDNGNKKGELTVSYNKETNSVAHNADNGKLTLYDDEIRKFYNRQGHFVGRAAQVGGMIYNMGRQYLESK